MALLFVIASTVFIQSVDALSRAFLASDAASSVLSFDDYVNEHGKGYQFGSPEYNRRKAVYERRVEGIVRHNSNPKRLWTAGVNRLSDATDEEFSLRLGWRHHGRKSDVSGPPHVGSLLEMTPPESYSWKNLTMMSHVRDQGACGSCWAVATAATLEANYEIAHGSFRPFSPQELVDCVQNPLNCGGKGGCDGATVELAMDWVVYHSLKTFDDSPYLAQESACQSKPFRNSKEQQGKLDADGRLLTLVTPTEMSAASLVAGKNDGDALTMGGQAIGLQGFTTLPANKYLPLIEALIQGPVGVTVAASGWNSYASGIFDDCNPTVNHAVLLTGYGKDSNGQQYWGLRNSWGKDWGEAGFIRLKRTDNEENECGIDRNPKDGVGCDGGPTEVKVCGTCGILYDSVVPNFQRTSDAVFTRK